VRKRLQWRGVSEGLQVGVVGVGRIGVFHAETLRALDGVAGVTVTDVDEARAAAVAADLGVGVVAEPGDLVAAGVDAVVIAAPTHAHASLIRLVAEAGVPAFCEKPVALEVAAIDQVMAAVEDAGTLVQVGFQRRFDAGFAAARAAVESGEIGTVLVVRAGTHDPAPPPESYIAGSGGIFRDLAIHDIDAVRFVTGQEVVEVYADGAVRETPWFADHGDVDVAVATLRLADGALAVLTGTRRDPRGYDVRLELFGTGESLVVGVDPRSPYRSLEPGAPAPQEPGYASFMDRFAAAYRAELAAFVDTVAAGGSSLCPLSEARADLLVALAAERSRAERRPVSIEEVTLEKAA
jgi:myo-inositol 2-dehydrogenase/D-chiro-inositol 1-dehydrogenase